ncbi:hypothetical protein BDP27DRAFT_1367659 [Rhodocollybia butyracea]|uniref:Uncharacterized protein n=1 Tax=Rhodocollybia butyracea TaxID=206335 RepID=A0A9P5U2W1_9AGAR|nr:hypothetical protein BDP27DRAFT_1367659 [Rhodocollybia butyracea]
MHIESNQSGSNYALFSSLQFFKFLQNRFSKDQRFLGMAKPISLHITNKKYRIPEHTEHTMAMSRLIFHFHDTHCRTAGCGNKEDSVLGIIRRTNTDLRVYTPSSGRMARYSMFAINLFCLSLVDPTGDVFDPEEDKPVIELALQI